MHRDEFTVFCNKNWAGKNCECINAPRSIEDVILYFERKPDGTEIDICVHCRNEKKDKNRVKWAKKADEKDPEEKKDPPGGPSKYFSMLSMR